MRQTFFKIFFDPTPKCANADSQTDTHAAAPDAEGEQAAPQTDKRDAASDSDGAPAQPLRRTHASEPKGAPARPSGGHPRSGARPEGCASAALRRTRVQLRLIPRAR